MKLREKIEVRFMHVKGHSVNEGNDGADGAAEVGKSLAFTRREHRAQAWVPLAAWDQADRESSRNAAASGADDKTQEAEKPGQKPERAKAKEEKPEKRTDREEEEDRRRARRSKMWKKADGGLWNCNGVEGKEEDVEAAMVQHNLTFLVLVEPKETVLSFSARIDEEDKKALGWAVVGKGRKTGERGGGVWIVAKDEDSIIRRCKRLKARSREKSWPRLQRRSCDREARRNKQRSLVYM